MRLQSNAGDTRVTGARHRRRSRRTIVTSTGIALLASMVVYVSASAYVYNRLSQVRPCRGSADGNTPASFHLVNDLTNEPIDVAPYLMPTAEDVRFASRGAPYIQIAAWWIPAEDGRRAPVVILVHGQNSCRHEPEILLAAGMLHRHGYATLLIDLRGHGDSTVEDGRCSAGSKEYLDALGAFDWLRSRGIPSTSIGIAGMSMGAAVAINAAGEEPGLAALWEDSAFADVPGIVRDELAHHGSPTALEPGALLLGKVISGYDLAAHSPLAEIAKVAGRPVFVTHGGADSLISPRYAEALAATVRANGGSVSPWIVEGAEHTRAITIDTALYETNLDAFFDAALVRP
ncbi:MAG: alpha/beta fold hydrolase [Chloroflexota bacterium]